MKPWLAYLVKYKYSFTIAFFVLWILFFDSNNLFFVNNQLKELKELRKQENYLQDDTEAMKKQKAELFSSIKNLEKFAREKYFFKRENEDVYILE